MATSQRTKKKTITNVTLEMANAASKVFAESKNRLNTIEAKMNEEITKIRSKYDPEINELNAAIEEPVKTLEAWAKETKSNWDKKSLEMTHCTIGFRTGTPKVEKDKGFTWEAVLTMLKTFKGLKHFVRTKEGVDKAAILQCRDKKVIAELEKKVKITIIQDETFFVELNKEEVTKAA